LFLRFSQLFKEQKSLDKRGIFNIAKLEVVIYRRTPEFLEDRRKLIGWMKNVAPNNSADQAMVWIEGKKSSYPA